MACRAVIHLLIDDSTKIDCSAERATCFADPFARGRATDSWANDETHSRAGHPGMAADVVALGEPM